MPFSFRTSVPARVARFENRLRRFLAPLRSVRAFALVTKGAAVMACYLLSLFVTGRIHGASRWMGAILAVTAALVVIQETDVRGSLRKGWLRILGTFVGALLATLYLSLHPFTFGGMMAMLLLLDLLCPLFRIPNNGQMASVTLVIIMFTSKAHPDLPPFENGLLRFVESAVGAALGVGAVWLNDRYYGRPPGRN